MLWLLSACTRPGGRLADNNSSSSIVLRSTSLPMPLQVIKLKQENEQLKQEFDDLVEQSKVGLPAAQARRARQHSMAACQADGDTAATAEPPITMPADRL